MEQLSLFDLEGTKEVRVKPSIARVKLSKSDIEKLSNYKLDDYVSDVEKDGLESTWTRICKYEVEHLNDVPDFLNIKNFGELYEIGLAIQDKLAKKKSGQYYTPDDVASIMSEWLLSCEGTGKLILTYLDLLGFEKSRELIESGNLYLYDFDGIALLICKTAISIKYGLDISDKIHDIYGDFLDKKVKLPMNCKVISNPPYAKIEEYGLNWNETEVLKDTSEFYSVFMEKIFSQAKSTVIITPFSFISGSKFYSLRKMMCNTGGGFIAAFDNVPGNIFCGRKHGIFNTNTANSVRAAITVLNRESDKKGFRVTPLIRFKNEQRAQLLKCDVLEALLNDEIQIVDSKNDSFKKVFKELDGVYKEWITKSKYKLRDLITKDETANLIDMPNTCRYYTTGSARKLSRGGSISIFIDDLDVYHFIYCLINSSFTYWWWRVFDGGITYPSSLLMDMPVPYNLLSYEDKIFFKNVFTEMNTNESKYIITKANAGAIQENIKFPEEFRTKINDRILGILGRDEKSSVFDVVHSNKFLGA